MNFIDICSGIGGFRSALEMYGHNCVAFAEIDKFAKQSYKAIYNTEGEEELNDITAITNEHFRRFRGNVEIITGGFPCQTFSIAGNRRGFEDTRGTVFFHIARAIKEIKPSYVLLENVKGLLSHDKGRTYGTIIQALDELGYIVEWGVFNSKFWGVPQNRERVYILVTRKDVFKMPKLFSLLKQQINVNTRLIDILETNVDESYFLSEKKTKKLTLNEDLSGRLNYYDFAQSDRICSAKEVSPTLNTMQGGDRQPKIAIKNFKEIVKVRKYEVDKQKLKILLKEHKTMSNKEIAKHLNQPITKVEHWFRNDNSFSVPDADVWKDLKKLLNIKTDEFDKSITTFVEKESGYDTTNRVYDTEHISPTLNTSNEPKVAVVGNTSNTHHNAHNIHDINGLSPTIAARDYKGAKQIVTPTHNKNKVRVRKLTPLECWRLQGFTDEQFYKAKNSGISNSQLYKQAGNAVTVNVVKAIVKELN